MRMLHRAYGAALRDDGNVGFPTTTVQQEAVDLLLAGTSVDLHGLPGSGRSSLLRRIGDDLADHGRQVRRVRGVAALADRPLEPLALAGLLGKRQTTQTTVAAAVAAVVDTVRDDRTVLVVDDVDDLDQTTVGTLAAAHAAHPFPLLSASAPRPPAASRPPRLPTEVRPGVVLEVPALTYLGVQTLLVDLIGPSIDAAVVSRVLTASGGIPGVVRALVEGAVRTGALARTDGLWTASADPLWTSSLGYALESFLRHLSPPALDGLHVLSLAGATSLSAARTLVGWEVLEELEGFRLLRFSPRGEGMVGVHPPVLVERFLRMGGVVRRLRLEQRLSQLPEKTRTSPYSTALLPAPPGRSGATSTMVTPDTPAFINRLLTVHRTRETDTRRDEWQTAPSSQTAAAYLQALLISDADSSVLHAVIDGTPRTGDPRDIVLFDVWSAMAVGLVDLDLDQAQSILDRSRVEMPAWAPLLDAVRVHITLWLDHAGNPDDQPLPEPGLPVPAPQIMVATRAELLVARARPAEALELLGRPGLSPDFASKVQTAVYGLALLLDAQFDEALRWSMATVDEARAHDDITTITTLTYTAATALLLQLRLDELRLLLSLPFAAGRHTVPQRPAELALLSIGATVALLDGQTATARDLGEQARRLDFGPSCFPLASPTYVLALLDNADLPPTEVRRVAADRLWADFDDLRSRSLVGAALWTGTFAVSRQPERCSDPHRRAHVQALLKLARAVPAGTAQHAETFVEALDSDDPALVLAAAEELADASQVYLAVRTYAHALQTLRDADDSANTAAVVEEARARLAPYGPDAVAVLNRLAAPPLTGRELEVARLAAGGMSNRAIADRLTISVRTVESHLHHVFQKVGVEDRATLARALVV